jgi:outer membrane protein W
MHIGFGKKFQVDLNIGPYFGFKIKDEISSSNELDESVIRGELQITEFKNFDFGIVYGIGFDYQIHERFSLGFDALYEKGMKVINEGNYKNSSIDFDFGINFHIGRKK